MLSRRHLRVKVLQALYAFFQSEGDDIAKGEKQLLTSTDKLYELYIHQLSFLVRLYDYNKNRIEEARKKYYPTESDLNPNLRLADNKVIAQIDENKDFRRWHTKLKINWGDEENMFHKLLQEIRTGEEYLKLISQETWTYKEDKELASLLITNYIADYELLRNYFEDRSIFWADEDFDISIMMVLKTLKLYKENWGPDHHLPPLFKAEEDGDEDEEGEDREYMIKLFRYTILRSEENGKLIEEQAENWELERIALMDIIIMKMALTELMVFPSIPIKVTINEYIEISKSYSSLKSKLFINGILDKLTIKLKRDGKIVKMGRGLME
jgi:N utilization substance protein B